MIKIYNNCLLRISHYGKTISPAGWNLAMPYGLGLKAELVPEYSICVVEVKSKTL
jgi:hypothetical protein